jgi:hypothetical protein
VSNKVDPKSETTVTAIAQGSVVKLPPDAAIGDLLRVTMKEAEPAVVYARTESIQALLADITTTAMVTFGVLCEENHVGGEDDTKSTLVASDVEIMLHNICANLAEKFRDRVVVP